MCSLHHRVHLMLEAYSQKTVNLGTSSPSGRKVVQISVNVTERFANT